MSKWRVLLVDDDAAIRAGVRHLFHRHPDFEVCGEAEHGREAVERAPTLKPDLIVLDLSMPVMTGLEAAPLLIQLLPEVSLILFTVHDGQEVQRLAHVAGIHAVVSKSKLCDCILTVAETLELHTALAIDDLIYLSCWSS